MSRLTVATVLLVFSPVPAIASESASRIDPDIVAQIEVGWPGGATPTECDPVLGFAEQIIDTPSGFPGPAITVDADGDGDLDIVAGNANGLSWHRNLNGLAAYAPGLPIATGPVSSIVAADVDGDGDNDLLWVGGSPQEITWTINTNGDGSFFGTLITDQVGALTRPSVRSADIDGDGDLDVVAAGVGAGSELVWFENLDGLGTLSAPSTITALASEHTLAADLDGDLDTDVLAGAAGVARWFENLDGAGGFDSTGQVFDAALGYPGATADLDGDGDPDVVLISPHLDAGSDCCLPHGGSGCSDAACEGTICAADPFCCAATWDSVCSEAASTDAGCQANCAAPVGNCCLAGSAAGCSDAPCQASVCASDDYCCSVSWDPICADAAIVDPACASCVIGEGLLAWVENDLDGIGAFGVPSVLSQSIQAPLLAVVDLDRDLDLDLISADPSNDTLLWLENVDANGSLVPRRLLSTGFAFPRSIEAADLDGDGDPDLVLSAAGAVVVYLNTFNDCDLSGVVDGCEAGVSESCRDRDHDGLPASLDCNDALPFCTTDCTDVDGDGFCADVDCDDGLPNCTLKCLDGDADGVLLCDGDCDDADPDCSNDCTDNDQDGFCGDIDCNDALEFCFDDCTDVDEDGFCVNLDCDESNPNCGADCTDSDSDGFCVTTDCDDTNSGCIDDCDDFDEDGVRVCDGDCDDVNPNCTFDCTDNDLDGWCSNVDCDEQNPFCNDNDCDDLDDDGFRLCEGDCDDMNPGCGLICTDTDGDGFCIDNDCNDTKPFCATSCTDNDDDGYCADFDCDDGKPACTLDCTDLDGDGACVDVDCDDTNPNCGVNCVDDDNDGYCLGFDCDDGSPVCTGTDCEDVDGDGVPACAGDCDDTVAGCTFDCSDDDNDGLCGDLDCDDTLAACTDDCADLDNDGVRICDGDCDDGNPTCTTDCTDADADGFCADTDCDDTKPGCTGDCTDDDGDDFCGLNDCDDTSAACTNDCDDGDNDGVRICDGDCDDANGACTFDCTDADGDTVCADVDCDDTKPFCAADCTDADDDGLCIDADCDDTKPLCTITCTDDDDDGFCVNVDCDDSAPLCNFNCDDLDSDGVRACEGDCDDTKPGCTSDCTDGDLDNFCIDLDCDDTNPACTVDCTDVDMDGLCVDVDCNDDDPDDVCAPFTIDVLLETGGPLITVNDVTINDDGDWVARVETLTGQQLFGTGHPALAEGDALAEPPGSAVLELGPVTLNNTTGGATVIPLAGPPAGQDSGIYLGGVLVLQEGDTISATGVPAGTTYHEFINVKLNDANRMGVVAVLMAPGGETAPVILDVELDGSLNVVSETLVANVGQFLFEQDNPIADFYGDPVSLLDTWHEFSISDVGHVMFYADLAGSPLYNSLMSLKARAVAQKGRLVSVASDQMVTNLDGHSLEVNNFGRYVFKAGVSNPSGRAVVNSRTVFVQEGDLLPTVGGFELGSVGNADGPVEIDDLGNVLWWGQWNEPNLSDTGLFLNDVLLVERQVTTVDGTVLQDLTPTAGAFKMSDNGQFVVFRAAFQGSSTYSAFRIEITPPPAVPDGTYVEGEPMRVGKDGSNVALSWDAGRCPAADYHLLIGDLDKVSGYEYNTNRCNLGISGEASFLLPEGNLFWVMVGVDEQNFEGVHGFDSSGAAREAKAGYVCGITGQVRGDECTPEP